MAPTAADCDQIIQAATEGNGLFMVGHICRFDPRVALAKEAIEQGRIGKIISMHARRNLSKAIGRLVLDDITLPNPSRNVTCRVAAKLRHSIAWDASPGK